MVPRKTMEEELKGQEKELSDDINSLNKKVSTLRPWLDSFLMHCIIIVKILGEAVQRCAKSTSRYCECLYIRLLLHY